MKKTVIYIFGPKRLAGTYFSNKPMVLEEGGWLKIGQTTNSDESIEVKDSALNRIRQETHTGIPEVCQIFDVFEYPERARVTDDTIRSILTDDVYKLESSKKHNSNVEFNKYEIKAGTEFVYGVTRKQVFNSIARFEHDLILKHHGEEDFEILMQCIKNNVQSASQYEFESDSPSSEMGTNSQWTDELWQSVKKRLAVQMKSNINIPKGKSYFLFQSETYKGQISYIAGYSVRFGLASVGIETYGGDDIKKMIESKIDTAPEDYPLKTVEVKQGSKNKDKWAWSITTPIDKSNENLVRWYVEQLISIYNFFEK